MNIKKNVITTSTVLALAVISSTPSWAMTPGTLADTNGDGIISAAEIKQSRRAQRAAALAQFDADGDGKLSRSEREAMKKARRAAITAKYDSDGDGKLSPTERKAAKKARISTIELQLDVDGNGVVSNAERAGFDEVRENRSGDRKKRTHAHRKERERGQNRTSDDSSAWQSPFLRVRRTIGRYPTIILEPLSLTG